MNSGQLLSGLLASGAGYCLLALFLAFRRRAWARRARKLAATSGVMLPGPLTGRVARFLRDEWLFGLLVTWAFLASLTGLLAPEDGWRSWAQSFPWILAGTPMLCVCFSYASTVWPRWKHPAPAV